MNRNLILCLIGLLLTGCTAAEKTPPLVSVTAAPSLPAARTVVSPPTPSVQPTHKVGTPTSRPTATRKPTVTVPVRTATPSVTPTATYDPQNIRTATLSPAALCPGASIPAPTPGFLYSEGGWLEDEVLDFLNAYGPQPLINAHERAVLNKEHTFGFYYQDVTNDSVPEVMLGLVSFYIFACQEGKYQTLFSLPPDAYMEPPSIVEIKDVNRDGIPELTLLTGFMTQGAHSYQVYAWNGLRFRNLLIPDRPEFPESGEIYVQANGSMYFQDLDGDDVQELIALNGMPVWEIYYSGLPWRNETWYYRWDGSHYIFYKQEFDPPQFRFQAVQDGDRLTLYGEYDGALEMYQQAIFSEELEWYSPEHRKFLQEVWLGNVGQEATPIPPNPDTNEYYYLAAYARYRIMLLYFVRGWLPEAQIVYETLQKKFPAGQTGHEYAQMAQAFWEDYQSSQDMGHACSKAVAYAAQHPEILKYLGSFVHGYQSMEYTPEDICPFR